MTQLLRVCTEDAPFRNVNGDLYQQKDGVSMGGGLSPVYANFYMSYIENIVIPSLDNPPIVYTRYVDDIFLVIDNIRTLNEIKEKFENLSVLKFTFEIEQKKSISFLDVQVTRRENKVDTAVYTKPTNNGQCLNYYSIAPDRYKTGLIRTLLHRGYIVSSSWENFNTEINRLKQVLVNNNYPMKLIEEEINKFIAKKMTVVTTEAKSKNVDLFYKSQNDI